MGVGWPASGRGAGTRANWSVLIHRSQVAAMRPRFGRSSFSSFAAPTSAFDSPASPVTSRAAIHSCMKEAAKLVMTSLMHLCIAAGSVRGNFQPSAWYERRRFATPYMLCLNTSIAFPEIGRTSRPPFRSSRNLFSCESFTCRLVFASAHAPAFLSACLPSLDNTKVARTEFFMTLLPSVVLAAPMAVSRIPTSCSAAALVGSNKAFTAVTSCLIVSGRFSTAMVAKNTLVSSAKVWTSAVEAFVCKSGLSKMMSASAIAPSASCKPSCSSGIRYTSSNAFNRVSCLPALWVNFFVKYARVMLEETGMPMPTTSL